MAILTKFWADVPFRGFVQMMLRGSYFKCRGEGWQIFWVVGQGAV